jgi:hypothetical protein
VAGGDLRAGGRVARREEEEGYFQMTLGVSRFEAFGLAQCKCAVATLVANNT